MRQLLALAKGIDWITDRFGWIAEWAVFLSCFISAGNAVVRYLLDTARTACSRSSGICSRPA